MLSMHHGEWMREMKAEKKVGIAILSRRKPLLADAATPGKER